MKKKVLLSVLVIFLVLTLVSCGGKEKIKGTTDDYFLALSNQRYELAKTYCVSGGKYYKFVDLVKEQREGIFLFYPTFTSHITKWNWIDNTEAFIDIEIVITAPTPLGVNANEIIKSLAFLTKVNGIWKLK